MKSPGTLVEMLRERALERPNAVVLTFLLDGEEKAAPLSYAELDLRARTIAAALAESGAKPGARALLLCESGVEVVWGLFGVLYAGMIAVPGYPLDPTRLDRSLERLQRIASDCEPTHVLSVSPMRQAVAGEAAKLPALAPARWLDLDGDAPLAARGAEPYAGTPDDVAILQYTSGSTGAPKGVVLTHGNVMANQAQIQVANQHTAETVLVAWVPLFHDMGLIAHLFQAIYLGAHAVLMTPLHFLQRPSRWLRAISRYRGTTSGAPNFAYDLCLQRGGAEEWAGLDLSCWTRAVSGGEPVRADTCERFLRALAPYGLRAGVISPTYGMAEAAALISSTPPGDMPTTFPAVLEPGSEVLRGSVAWVAAGPPCIDTSVIAVDPDTLRRVGEGEIGELWIQGPQVGRGYWNDAARTREFFGAQLASGEGPYLRTGDLGTLRDGLVYVTGRRKDMIVVRGENHYPQDIEATLEGAHPGLRAGCGIAFAVAGAAGEELVIVHEVDARRLGDPEAALDRVQTLVAQQHGLRPGAICLIEARTLPKTSSGKLARSACREEYRAGRLRIVAQRGAKAAPTPEKAPEPDRAAQTSGTQAAAQRAEIERWMRSWVAEHRGCDAAQLASSALDQWGLDSAEAVGLVAELSRKVGRELPATLLWERPTVEAVSAFVLGQAESAPEVARSAAGAEAPLAVVGIGCRFPGAHGADAFWQLLASGTDAIEEVPKSRWDLEELYDPEPGTPGKLYARHGGFVHDVDQFDPAFFGISPAEAAAMDPQQRLLLETALEAIEDAGLSVRELEGRRVGVFVGISTSDYAFLQVSSGDPERFSAYVGTGITSSVAAGRIAHAFGLMGPTLAVDTACSSSLVALHLASASLRRGECDFALVGGVNALLSPELTLFSCQAGTLAPDGRCKSFDESADGYVRAEGCGVVLLRRESEALAARQRVRARVRGSAVNHDGRALALTAPSGLAQTELIRAALADAQLEPAAVSYVEAHGSGTKLGDPIEARSLGAVYAAGRDPALPLRIGSVKTNVGHLEAAAGICGFIKVVLALEHREIPAQLHCRTPNQRIPWADLRIALADRMQSWTAPAGAARVAAVSSFGISGTNAHVIVQEAAERTRTAASAEPRVELLTLSARDPEALRASAAQMAEHLERHAGDPRALADACFTAQIARSEHPHRIAVRGASGVEIAAQLRAWMSGEPAPHVACNGARDAREPRIAYLFSGQGTQYPGMGKALFDAEPIFRSAILRCSEHLGPIFMGRDLVSVLFSRPDDPLLHETAVSQPALFAVQIALAETLRSWGVQPAVVVGHSAGELAAACTARVFDWRTGLELAAARGRVMQSLARGGLMAALESEEESLAAALADLPADVAVAAYNGPGRAVISGRRESVEKIGAELAAHGARFTPLAVSHASHSPLVEPILAELEKIVAGHALAEPSLPLVSNLSGALADRTIATPLYWRRHLREPVRFDLGLKTLDGLAPDVYLEIGPHPTLLGVVSAHLADAAEPQPLRVPTLRRTQGDREQMLETLGRLYAAGAPIAWRAVAGERDLCRTALPGHPLRRRRFWLGSERSRSAVRPRSDARAAWLGPRLHVAGLAAVFDARADLPGWEVWSDHSARGEAVMPAAGLLELALAAARRVLGDGAALHDVQIPLPLWLDPGRCEAIQVLVSERRGAEASVSVHARGPDPEAGWTQHLRARAKVDERVSHGSVRSAEALVEGRSLDPAELYARLEQAGLSYGPAFRSVTALSVSEREAFVRLELPEGWSALPPHEAVAPSLLDGAFQAVAAWLPASAQALVPSSLDRVVCLGRGRASAARLRVLRADALGAVVDVELLDAQGAVQLAVHGLLLRAAQWLSAPRASGLRSFVWEPSPAPLAAALLPSERVGGWWLLDSGTPLGESIAARLRAAGARVRVVTPASATRRVAADRFEIDLADPQAFETLLEGDVPRGVLHLWALEPGDGTAARAPERARSLCDGALGLLRALVSGERGASAQLWIVAAGAEAVRAGEAAPQLAPAAAALFGLARVVEFEHPELRCTTIDLDPADVASAGDALWSELCSPGRGSRVAYRDGVRLAPRLAPAPSTSATPHPIDADGAYLITGGVGALGLQVARWLVEQGARHLTLVSRHDAAPARQQQLELLQARCPDLRQRRADVSQREAVAEVLAEIRAQGRPLRGIFHLAGVLEDAPLLAIDSARLDAMLGAKLRGGWHLHELTADDPLSSFVLFSSIGSLVGLPGQGGYAAANAFLDALAHQRRARGLPAISINWSVWKGEGMAPSAAQERLARRGFEALEPEAGLRALAAVLAANPAQIAVLSADEQALRALDARSRAAQPGSWREELRALPGSARVDQCVRRIRAVLRDVLGLEAAYEAASDAPLIDLGLDSLRAVELRNELARRTGLRLPASFAFDAATLRGAAVALVERLGLTEPAPGAEANAADLASLTSSELLGLVDRALNEAGAAAEVER